jgi:S1-C subfamily serine protease
MAVVLSRWTSRRRLRVKKQAYYRVALLVLIVALSVTIAACGGRPAGPSADTQGGGPAQTGGQSPRAQQAQLGITGEPDQEEPRGLLVTGFLSSPEASPLGIIGVKVGDKIISCNGQQERIATRLVAALDGLESRGEPVVLVVMRDGEEVRLERTEKLAGAGSDEGLE